MIITQWSSLIWSFKFWGRWMYYGMQVTLVCEGHHIGVFTARQILLTLWEKSWFIYSSIHCSDRFKSQSSPPLATSSRPGPGLLRNLWYFTESFFARGGSGNVKPSVSETVWCTFWNAARETDADNCERPVLADGISVNSKEARGAEG